MRYFHVGFGLGGRGVGGKVVPKFLIQDSDYKICFFFFEVNNNESMIAQYGWYVNNFAWYYRMHF